MTSIFKLVPVFSYPVSLWAERVDLSLQRSGHDLTVAKANTDAAAAAFSKLPLDVARLVPSTTVSYEDVIEFLRNFDEAPLFLSQVLSLPMPQDERPSIFFAYLCDRIKKTMPPKADATHIKLMAWERLKQVLPSDLASSLLWCKKDQPPTNDTLRKVDEAFLRTKSKPQGVAAICDTSASPTATDALVAAVTQLGEVMLGMQGQLNQLSGQLQPGPSSTPIPQNRTDNRPSQRGRGGATASHYPHYSQPRDQTNVRCYNCGQLGHMRAQCPSGTAAVRPHQSALAGTRDPALCYYHNKFGRDSEKCAGRCAMSPAHGSRRLN